VVVILLPTPAVSSISHPQHPVSNISRKDSLPSTIVSKVCIKISLNNIWGYRTSLPVNPDSFVMSFCVVNSEGIGLEARDAVVSFSGQAIGSVK